MARGIEYWKTGQNYFAFHYVATPQEVFLVLTDHLSTSITADLAAGRITPVADWHRLYYIDSDITITPDRKQLYRLDTNWNDINLVINSSRAFDGLEIILKKVGGVNPVNITLAGGGTIDGRTSLVMTADMESVRLIYDIDVTIWWVV